MRGPIVGAEISVGTEAPQLQAGRMIRLRLDARQGANGFPVTAITVELHPMDCGRAMFGPEGARELARYLTAMADTVEAERNEP